MELCGGAAYDGAALRRSGTAADGGCDMDRAFGIFIQEEQKEWKQLRRWKD